MRIVREALGTWVLLDAIFAVLFQAGQISVANTPASANYRS